MNPRQTAAAAMIRKWAGPTEAELRAAWEHLSDADLRRLSDEARAKGNLAGSVMLMDEWCKRVSARVGLTECVGDPVPASMRDAA